jgi:hypothetical protein
MQSRGNPNDADFALEMEADMPPTAALEKRLVKSLADVQQESE